MPIYMRIDGVRGNATNHGHKEWNSSTANGGVWKTTNFLTNDSAAGATAGRPKIKVFMCPSDTSVVQISRMSLSSGAHAIESRDASAQFKVEHLIEQVRSHGPNGKLYIATDAGVYQNSSQFDGQGRLLMGNDGGVWRSGAANRARATNNLKQLGIGCHGTATVEIIVTDAGGGVLATHRLQNATLSRHPGGVLVALGDGSVR